MSTSISSPDRQITWGVLTWGIDADWTALNRQSRSVRARIVGFAIREQGRAEVAFGAVAEQRDNDGLGSDVTSHASPSTGRSRSVALHPALLRRSRSVPFIVGHLRCVRRRIFVQGPSRSRKNVVVLPIETLAFVSSPSCTKGGCGVTSEKSPADRLVADCRT